MNQHGTKETRASVQLWAAEPVQKEKNPFLNSAKLEDVAGGYFAFVLQIKEVEMGLFVF